MHRVMEVWKDIPGYEGRYQASSEGRIRSLDRPVRVVAHGTETTRIMKGRILRPGKYSPSGHVSVVLGHGAPGSPVHQLVALTFLGPRPAGTEVCHADGNPLNNAVNNLRYDTRRENILDVYRQGAAYKKLNMNDVQQIRKLLAEGRTGREIADRFGISPTCVTNIKNGRTFAWLKEPSV